MSCILTFFFFKQKTAYEMRISDWSSDVCSSDLVVAPAELVVDAQDGFQVAQQMLLGQEVADRGADHRRAAEAAADDHLEADLAGRVAADLQADVVKAHGGAIVRRAGHGELELERQEREFRMQARPLGDHPAVDERKIGKAESRERGD